MLPFFSFLIGGHIAESRGVLHAFLWLDFFFNQDECHFREL